MNDVIEKVISSLFIFPFAIAAILALWVGLGILIYELCKWLKDWR